MSKLVKPEEAEIGARIKTRRMLLGISQEKLAEQLGLTFQQVQKYEKGVNRVSGARIARLAEILQVSPDWLLKGDVKSGVDEMPEPDRHGIEAWRMVAALPSIEAKTAALNAIRAIINAFAPPTPAA
ncbi:helix-turn-helix domain-containing protein [Xanthobacter aminoxidans]|uniref:helix-turn-helix domain-containing protein n=1 Tax=Xanthobacter aminoxidans TaxID=186280 RepID=UPI002022FD35|nr:helix-turn-helix transcriptional regulator [Xanthobacter aminoxidans]MCL8382106.1 helix-turn-helix domain-containing protein [Xanthobacter aminoxidans]